MAVINHTITYNAKNFAELVDLIECFIGSVGVGTISSFEAQKSSNGQWQGVINYAGSYVDYLTLEVITHNRMILQYAPSLDPPQPNKKNLRVWCNGEEIGITSVTLVGVSDHLKVTMPSNTFEAGDVCELSFCNIDGMNVSGVICTSFVRNLANNIL